MTQEEFKELVIRIDNHLRDYDKDKEYMSGSYIAQDGTYVLMGRHFDNCGKIDKDTPDSDMPREINNALVNRFNLNRGYYTPLPDNTVNIRMFGMHVSDKKAAKEVSLNCARKYKDIEKQIKFEINWILSRCYNVNDVNLSNILECLWYDYRDIFNDRIASIIKNEVNTLAEVGRINVW